MIWLLPTRAATGIWHNWWWNYYQANIQFSRLSQWFRNLSFGKICTMYFWNTTNEWHLRDPKCRNLCYHKPVLKDLTTAASTLHKLAQARPKFSKTWAWPMLVWMRKTWARPRLTWPRFWVRLRRYVVWTPLRRYVNVKTRPKFKLLRQKFWNIKSFCPP